MLRAPSEILSVKSFHPIYYHLEIQANPKQNWPKNWISYIFEWKCSKHGKKKWMNPAQTSSLWYVPLMLCNRVGWENFHYIECKLPLWITSSLMMTESSLKFLGSVYSSSTFFFLGLKLYLKIQPQTSFDYNNLERPIWKFPKTVTLGILHRGLKPAHTSCTHKLHTQQTSQKVRKKVFSWERFICTEFTFYKIHTLRIVSRFFGQFSLGLARSSRW